MVAERNVQSTGQELWERSKARAQMTSADDKSLAIETRSTESGETCCATIRECYDFADQETEELKCYEKAREAWFDPGNDV